MNAPAPTSHVVEWSAHAHAFRIRSVAEFIACNVQRFFEEICDDYALLGFFESREEARKFVEQRTVAVTAHCSFHDRHGAIAA